MAVTRASGRLDDAALYSTRRQSHVGHSFASQTQRPYGSGTVNVVSITHSSLLLLLRLLLLTSSSATEDERIEWVGRSTYRTGTKDHGSELATHDGSERNETEGGVTPPAKAATILLLLPGLLTRDC
ncbi:hypothetical protein AND_002778 [Anopheles darlingi]|uniref:Uncharacterized protein n=1 Tax=Anopheles darlingi TaxID=43151 RepID=W5JMX0_ANODA|nr:hypothetical protein AND_002778 [Anopheles darlingi]